MTRARALIFPLGTFFARTGAGRASRYAARGPDIRQMVLDLPCGRVVSAKRQADSN
jgi:hypothetical protein